MFNIYFFLIDLVNGSIECKSLNKNLLLPKLSLKTPEFRDIAKRDSTMWGK